MNNLKTILSPERITLDSDARSKKRVLEQVSELCATKEDAELYYHLLLNREKLGSTALGEGVALPHCRVPNLQHSIACFIRLPHGIDFHAPDEQNVDLIFGLFVPEHETNEHLQILAQLAQLFSQATIREQIRQAHDVQKVFHLLAETRIDS